LVGDAYENNPHAYARAGMRIFFIDPISYVLFLFSAILGTILASDLGEISNGKKNPNELSNSELL
jgi:hypothetical protein